MVCDSEISKVRCGMVAGDCGNGQFQRALLPAVLKVLLSSQKSSEPEFTLDSSHFIFRQTVSMGWMSSFKACVCFLHFVWVLSVL